MEVKTIEPDQKDQLLNLEEGHFGDLKGIDIKPSKLTKTISAFANASGGELYVGIEEEELNGRKVRRWRGFDDQEAANSHLQVLNELFPLADGYSAVFLGAKGEPGYVLQILVHKSREIVEASDGSVFARKGAQNLPVNTLEKLEKLRLDKGVTSFESHTLDVEKTTVTNSIVLIEFLLKVIPLGEPDPWLRKQLLLKKDKPTVASAVLFAEEPQAILPKRCGIKLLRYETRSAEGSRETLSFQPVTIEGHTYRQIYDAVAHTVKEVEKIRVLGPKGLQRVRYPQETLHEIITNAVLHRDYSLASDIQIRIFDNRIEVENPGCLPGHITPDNILDEQFARNGAIVRLINKFPNPPNKDVGEGLNTAFEAMRRLRLKEPIIEEKPNSVLVTIRHEPLASPEDAVLKYLENHDEVTNRIGRELTGITSENQMKEVFYRLRDRKLIERVPGKAGSASAWQKTPG